MTLRLVSRRRFLHVCGVGGGLALGGSAWPLVWGKDVPIDDKLIVRQADPLNAEPALVSLVANWITPVDQFFVRCHGGIPKINAENFTLRIEGLTEKPLSLTLEDLKKYASASTTATITCAGNRRSEFGDDRIKGVQWQAGAIGNARWGGVELADVLRAAGLKAEAKHVWFEGADDVKHQDETIHFGASVPLERVMDTAGDKVGVLLVTTMNEKPLTAEHGAPLRAVTSGFIGARSVKWLKRIVVSDKPSSNHFVTHAYKVVDEDTAAAQETADPIYQYVLNSAIATVDRNGALRVRGYALPSGKPGARIKRVELSLDGGKTWRPAKLDEPAADYCWQLWKAELALPNGEAGRILVRATDTTGAEQPRTMPFNAKGYQYNAWHSVKA